MGVVRGALLGPETTGPSSSRSRWLVVLPGGVLLVVVALGSRGLESVLVTFPGFAQNANGAIHPRGSGLAGQAVELRREAD